MFSFSSALNTQVHAQVCDMFWQVFHGAKLGFADKYELIFVESGHFPHIERAEELGTVLSGWLSSA